MMLDFDALLKKKVDEGRRSERQTLPPIPNAKIEMKPMDAVKNFLEDRQYDDQPFKLEGPASLGSVQKILREEQPDEYMHNDDVKKTFNIVKETNTNPHPYADYFKRKPKDD